MNTERIREERIEPVGDYTLHSSNLRCDNMSMKGGENTRNLVNILSWQWGKVHFLSQAIACEAHVVWDT